MYAPSSATSGPLLSSTTPRPPIAGHHHERVIAGSVAAVVDEFRFGVLPPCQTDRVPREIGLVAVARKRHAAMQRTRLPCCTADTSAYRQGLNGSRRRPQVRRRPRASRHRRRHRDRVASRAASSAARVRSREPVIPSGMKIRAFQQFADSRYAARNASDVAEQSKADVRILELRAGIARNW